MNFPVSLIQLITTGAWGKLRVSSTNFPSIEVSLNNVPRKDFFMVGQVLLKFCSIDLTYILRSEEIFLLFLLTGRVGRVRNV